MLQVFTSTEDGTGVGTAQKSITKEVLPIVNKIAMAATPFATTTPCCDQPKVTLLDMTTEPMCQQVDTSFEDVVVVEDASDDEEVVSDMGAPIEDPIYLITIEDSPTLSMVEIKAEEGQLKEDPPIEAVSSPATTTTNRDDHGCPPVHPSSPPSMARRHCKSYDTLSLRRSNRIAQHRVLKDLGFLGDDGKLNEDTIQHYADCLKKLLPPDVLERLMGLKGCEFWSMLAEVAFHLV